MADGPICDLVLLTWNRRDLLEPCLRRILEHTHLPSRVIIVDNGSTDPDALAFLETVRGTQSVDVVIMRLGQQRSIAAALNAGLAQTRAPWMCILNNDILVTPGWLEELLAVAQAHPNLGLINPMSNHFNMDPGRHETLETMARRLEARRDQWVEASQCVGFCMLLPRRVLDRVGYLDETFAPMYFEDTDYCLRVRQADFDCGIAEGAYVYHHRNATIRHDPLRDQRFRDNEARFHRKWPDRQRPQRIAWVMSTCAGLEASAVRDGIRRLANEDHKVWVFHTRETEACLPRHIQVVPQRLPRSVFRYGVLWRLLTKKKRFHRVIVVGQDRAGVPRWVRLARGAAVESFTPAAR